MHKLWAWLFGMRPWQGIVVARIEPGDTVIYRTEEILEDKQRDYVLNFLRKEFPEQRVLVVDGGDELQVIRPARSNG